MDSLFSSPEYILLTKNVVLTDEVIYNMSKYSKIYVGGGYIGKLDLIPNSIKELNINVHTKRELGRFPLFLEQLTTESKYQDYVDLPHTLKFFINKDTITQRTIDSLKYGLEYIYMNYFSGTNFVLPDSVQTIIFNNKISGFQCDNPITKFPSNLKKLVLPNVYKFNLNGILPDGLESLIICTIKNNYELTILPSSLKHLIFCNSDFNQQLNNLPSGLESLIFQGYHSFNQSIDNLPENIKILEIPSSSFMQKINNLPNGLEYFDIHINKNNIDIITNLPNKIKKLKISVTCDDELICSQILSSLQNNFSVKSLSLDGFIIVNYLPLNLVHLKVKKPFQYIQKSIIVADLSSIQFIEINDFEERNSISEIYPHITFI